MAHDRQVAGIRCMQVLELLSEYIDGELAAEMVTQLEDHLRGCDWCERFGGELQDVVRGLRQQLAEPEPIADDVLERLNRRFDAEL